MASFAYIGVMMIFTPVTAETVKHEPIPGLGSPHYSSRPENCPQCKAHAAAPKKAHVCGYSVCAACSFDELDRVKARAQANKRMRGANKVKFEAIKPSWAPRPKFPKGFDPSEVVIANAQHLKYKPGPNEPKWGSA